MKKLTEGTYDVRLEVGPYGVEAVSVVEVDTGRRLWKSWAVPRSTVMAMFDAAEMVQEVHDRG